ncbi:MAG: tetratricopeptide repeat protein [Bacteroidota bacterium]
MNRFLTVLFCICTFLADAQTSEKYNSDYENFYRAEELFQKEQYAAARIEFRSFMDEYRVVNDPMYIKAAYYEGISALELFNNDAVGLLESFLRQYPESIYHHEIYFRLGKYFYQKKNYDDALVWFNKLKSKDVEPDNRDEFYFKLGYCNFETENYDQARSAFHEVKDGTSQYAAPALYYYSHIAYMNGSYQQALEGFTRLKNDERFKQVVPYYIAQIHHKQGDYQAVVEYAPVVIDSISPAYRNDMNHIIGNSYYRLGKFDEAVPYLESYNAKSKTTREDEYELGYSYYKSQDYQRAIKTLDKVTRIKDSLAQYAYYHIGECCTKMGDQISARSAYSEAADIEADSKLQEDALYNFAVLSYKLDIDPYDEAVVALEQFLQKYPNSPRKNDVYQYLVNVYTTTNNYTKALASLDKLPNKDARLKTAYQLVAFNYGVDQFQKEDYRGALKAFELVEKYPIDGVILGKAKFWTADAYYRLNEMDKSIRNYKDFIALPATNAQELKAEAYYNIGYAYLKKGDATLAVDAFNIYCKSGIKDKRKLTDGYMRAGDCYYVLGQNDQAVKNYQDALKLNVAYQDQALFYSAKAYGFSDKNDQKIKMLHDLINNYSKSKYIMTATMELADTYKAKQDLNNALKYYQLIVTDYPDATIAVESRVEIADIYYKKGEYAKSETEYKQILAMYGAERTVCEKCTRGLIDVYKALKQPEKAVSVATEYGCASLQDDEQEDLFYSPAIEAYKDSLYSLAITNFGKYLERFPDGKYRVEARIYKANSHWALNQRDEAVEVYKEALEGPNDIFTEFAAYRVAQHLYNNHIYDQALIYYDRLEKAGSKPSTLFNAKLGLMRCHFLVENWSSAAVYAKEVLASSQINNTLRLEAEYAKGISSYRMESYADAKTSLEWIVKNTTTVMAAEAKYTLCEMYYKMQDYVKSEAQIKELLQMKPKYNFWVAKALILQSRIQIINDDLFKAEQTLKMVLDHYKEQNDGILAEANELWDELMQLKNKTKSVEESGEAEIELNENNGN